VMTWPLAGHIVFAIGTGFACAVLVTSYPVVISPQYAALFGTFILYPAMVALCGNSIDRVAVDVNLAALFVHTNRGEAMARPRAADDFEAIRRWGGGATAGAHAGGAR
jgi:hypothetical protein